MEMDCILNLHATKTFSTSFRDIRTACRAFAAFGVKGDVKLLG